MHTHTHTAHTCTHEHTHTHGPAGYPGQTDCKHHRLGGLNHRHLFPRISGDWNSQIKERAGLVFGDGPLLLCAHTALARSMRTVLLPLLTRIQTHHGAPPSRLHLNLRTSSSHHTEVGLPHRNCGQTQTLSPNTYAHAHLSRTPKAAHLCLQESFP